MEKMKSHEELRVCAHTEGRCLIQQTRAREMDAYTLATACMSMMARATEFMTPEQVERFREYCIQHEFWTPGGSE